MTMTAEAAGCACGGVAGCRKGSEGRGGGEAGMERSGGDDGRKNPSWGKAQIRGGVEGFERPRRETHTFFTSPLHLCPAHALPFVSTSHHGGDGSPGGEGTSWLCALSLPTRVGSSAVHVHGRLPPLPARSGEGVEGGRSGGGGGNQPGQLAAALAPARCPASTGSRGACREPGRTRGGGKGGETEGEHVRGGGAGGRWPQRARRVGPRARGRDWRLSRWLAAMPTPSPRPTVSSSNLTKIWEVGLLPTWQRVKQRRGRVHTGWVRREGHVQTRVPNGYRRNEGGARDAPPRRARAHRRRRPGGERSVARLPPLSSRSGTVCRLEGYKKPVRRELTHLWERGLEGREGPKPSPTPQTTASGLGRGRFSSRRTSYMLSCPSSCLDTSHVHPPAHQPPPRCWLSPPTPSWWGTSPGNKSGTRRTDTPAEGSRRLRAEDSPQKRASGSPSGPFRCGCPAHDALLRTTLPPSVPAVNDVGDHHPGLRDRRPVAGRGRPTRALPVPPLPRPSHALAHHTPGVEADAAGGPRRGGGWGPNGWPAGPTGLVPATTGRRLCGLLFRYNFSPAPLAPFIQTRFLGAAGGPLLPRAPNCIPRVLARQPGWREGERALG